MGKEATKNIAVLMAVYNGELYLDEQIISIINQTYINWVLFISDDHSNDSSREIIKKYMKLYPDKICLFENATDNSGAKCNFDNVMRQTHNFNYYMFSDQDDIWMPEKMSVMINEIQIFEMKFGEDCPLLVYSDLEVVNSKAELIFPSFVKSSGYSLPTKNIIQQFLLYNCIPGCAMLFNASLREQVISIPSAAYMHDWWLALAAACFGKIIQINIPLMKYRQHSANSIGMIEYQSNKERLAKYASGSKLRKAIENNREMKKLRREQTEKFLEIYDNKLDKEQRMLVIKYIEALSIRSIKSIIWALNHGFIFMNYMYTIKFFWL